MATRQSTIDALLDQLSGAGTVTTLKMFGEYCLYLDGKPVALVCRDHLYVKPTDDGRAYVPDVSQEPPFPGIRPYLLIPTDRADQWVYRETLCRLLRITFEALPPPKSRKRRLSLSRSEGERGG